MLVARVHHGGQNSILSALDGANPGNCIYELSHQGMAWQQRAMENVDGATAARDWLQATRVYSIASYPHLKGDMLAEQTQTNHAREEAAKHLPHEIKQLNCPVSGGGLAMLTINMPSIGLSAK